jgi:hypothetical protein
MAVVRQGSRTSATVVVGKKSMQLIGSCICRRVPGSNGKENILLPCKASTGGSSVVLASGGSNTYCIIDFFHHQHHQKGGMPMTRFSETLNDGHLMLVGPSAMTV